MSTAKFTPTHTILLSAILLMLGILACPNTPWEGGDPARELERMHAQVFHDQRNRPSALEAMNVLVRGVQGNPAPGVSIRIFDPLSASGTQDSLTASRESVFYEGVTSADGSCSASIRLPASQSELAIEWSAPNSPVIVARTVVQRHELANLELSLQFP